MRAKRYCIVMPFGGLEGAKDAAHVALDDNILAGEVIEMTPEIAKAYKSVEKKRLAGCAIAAIE